MQYHKYLIIIVLKIFAITTIKAQKATTWQLDFATNFTEPRILESSVSITDRRNFRVYTNQDAVIKPSFAISLINTSSTWVSHVFRYALIPIGGSQSFEVLPSNISPRVPLISNNYTGKNNQFSYEVRLQLNNLYERLLLKQKTDSLRRWEVFLGIGIGASFPSVLSWDVNNPAANTTIPYAENGITGNIRIENSTGVRNNLFGWFIPIELSYTYRINYRFSVNMAYFVQLPQLYSGSPTLANRVYFVNFSNGYAAQSVSDASSLVHGARLGLSFHFNFRKPNF